MISHDGQHKRTPRIAVIGGGITGLAAANRLIELAPDTRLTLFEAGERLGGVLQTERHDGYLVELSADNFITNVPWGVELCHRLGMADQLLPTRESQRRAFVVRGGRLLPVPVGFHLLSPRRIWPLFRSPLLSWPGKLRVLCEPFVRRRRDNGDESLASFARRRLGGEAYERLVQPLVAGIYTADAEQLSMAAALPRFVEMERRWGSLIRGARHEMPRQADSSGSSGARYGLFVAPRDGMSSLVGALAERLPPESVRYDSAVTRVGQSGDAWSLTVDGVDTEFDAIILAVPAFAAGTLLSQTSAELAGELQQISYAGSAIVVLGYRREQITRGWDGFGFVVPGIERHEILAGSYSSAKFDGRAPADRVLIRVFLGGAERPDQLELNDATLIQKAMADLGKLLGIEGAPELTRVVRWPRSMPQYHVGHVELVRRIETLAARWPTLALAGNAYHGVGVPSCIHSGEHAAQRVLAALGAQTVGCD
jgi:oxygen-dependent protoporphyrinogen oxidase